LAADAATIFAADGSSTLWRLDDTTGSATAVGTGSFSVRQLAFAPDGTLWGVGTPLAGGGERLITLDTTNGASTQATASVTALGFGIRDMTFGNGGQLYLAHHRAGGPGSGVSTYEASTLDGSSGNFIGGSGGGGAVGTLPNGNLLIIGYSTLFSVVAAPSGASTSLGGLTAPDTCLTPAPQSPFGGGYDVLAVDPASGASPMAFVADGDELCRIDVNGLTISSVGLFSANGGPTSLAGIAVAPVPEPSAVALVLVAGLALARRRP